MITNDGAAADPQRKSLMNSLEKLNDKIAMLETVAGMSEKMVDKMKRTENVPKVINGAVPVEKQITVPDIIDLFDGVSVRMQSLIDKIGSNIDRTINMIE